MAASGGEDEESSDPTVATVGEAAGVRRVPPANLGINCTPSRRVADDRRAGGCKVVRNARNGGESLFQVVRDGTPVKQDGLYSGAGGKGEVVGGRQDVGRRRRRRPRHAVQAGSVWEGADQLGQKGRTGGTGREAAAVWSSSEGACQQGRGCAGSLDAAAAVPSTPAADGAAAGVAGVAGADSED